MRDNEQRRPEAEADGIIDGRNAVIEALRAGTTMDKIYLAKGETDKTLGHIASKARAAGIVVVEADRRKLDGMSRTHAHQGVIALAAVREYVTVQSLLDAAAAKGEPPLLVVCDEISDPHNLGAILRVRRSPRGHHPQAPQRRSDGHCGQDLRRGRQLYAGGTGGQYPVPAEGSEKAGHLGVRHCRRGNDPAL